MVYKMKKLCLLLLLFTASCSTTKHVEKKVLGDTEAFDKIGQEWNKRNPPHFDTGFKTVRDTVQGNLDTYTEVLYERGADDTVFVDRIKTVTQIKYIHDSTVGLIVDERELDQQKAETIKYKDLYNSQKDKTIDATNTAKRWQWWLIAVVAIILLGIFLLIKFK
jgi:hypothetical protein